jgi:hypothetical protein
MQTAFVDRGDGSQAQSSYNHMSQEIAQLVIEILRLIELNKQDRVLQGVLLEGDRLSEIPIVPAEGEIIDATVIEFLPTPAKYQLPPSGDELAIGIPQLPPPPLNQTEIAEQLIAGTVDRLSECFSFENVYQSELYRFEQEGDRLIVLDPRDREILAFEKLGNAYDITSNRMSIGQMQEFLQVRYQVEDQGLEAITTNFKTQTESLGNLAPEGTQAAFVADYLLQGYQTDTAQFQTYQFNQDSQGNLSITHTGTPTTYDLTQNPSGPAVLRTSEGAIVEANLTESDKHGFSEVSRYAQAHPIAVERGRAGVEIDSRSGI